MSQHDQVIANSDGATVRADINSALAAIFTNSSGTSAPSTTVAHQFWADTTANLLKKRNAANSGWLSVRTLDEAFSLSRSSNTILGVSDVGKVVNATSTFTQTLTAAATLGDGWFVDYRNNGSGVITFDPNSTETIDGATTLKIYPGESCRITCNGTAFTTTGLVAASNYKVGTFTYNVALASGSVAYTGVGFKPKAVEFIANIDATGNTSTGFSDGTSHRCFYAPSATTWTAFSAAIALSDGTNGASATVQSFDDDGFTLAWTKSGSPSGTGTVSYKAYR